MAWTLHTRGLPFRCQATRTPRPVPGGSQPLPLLHVGNASRQSARVDRNGHKSRPPDEFSPRVFLKLASRLLLKKNKQERQQPRKDEETEQLTNARPWKNDSGHTGMCCFYETGQVSSSFCPLCLISTQGIASVDEGIIGTQWNSELVGALALDWESSFSTAV